MIRTLSLAALLLGACTPAAPPAPVPPDPGGFVQQAGLRTALAARGPVVRHLRTIGEIEVGEDQVSVVNLRFSGWVERVHVEQTGAEVRRGDALFDVYSPDLVAAQEELLVAVRESGPESVAATAAGRRLELLGVDPRDIGRVVDGDEVTRAVPIRAPQGGFVLHKDVVQGARVQEGQDLYRIGNLTKIWVTAELYEFDAPWVEIGQPAQMALSLQPGPPIEGRVSYVHPTLDPVTRTLRVRLEFDNPGLRLRPGMFTAVALQVERRDAAVVIPAEAVLADDLGERVIVMDAGGALRAREVRTGLSGTDHLVEILDGLEAGERVVTSGHLLLDVDARPEEALQRLTAAAPGEDPVDGDEADGGRVFACPVHPEHGGEAPGRCPACGRFLERRAADPLPDAVPEPE